MELEIRGHHLPGRHWTVDAEDAVWALEITVVASDGGPDFRGPAVQRRRGERFVYLTWGDVGADGTFRMFRRAKLMLVDLAPLVDADRVVATVDLTDECGVPRCARLRAPALELITA